MKKFLLSAAISAVAAMPAVSVAQTMPKLSEDGVDLYVGLQYCTRWDNSDVFPGDSAGIYRISSGNSALSPFKVPITPNGGIAYHNGKAYINVFDDENTSADQITPVWQVIDLATGNVEKSITGETGSGITTTITYDPTEDVIYGVVSANDSRRFYLAKIDPETGEQTNVGWLTENPIAGEAPYLAIHRCATAAEALERGVMGFMFDRAEAIARSAGKQSIRIDTHEGNLPMQRALEKSGFARCGTIFLKGGAEDGDPRIAFEKLL